MKAKALKISFASLLIGSFSLVTVFSHGKPQKVTQLSAHTSSQDQEQVKCHNSDGFWCYWFEINRDELLVSDECYATEVDCNCAMNEWTKQSGTQRLIYRCREISKELLVEATNDCDVKKDYACSWKSNIAGKLKTMEEIAKLRQAKKPDTKPKKRTRTKRKRTQRK